MGASSYSRSHGSQTQQNDVLSDRLRRAGKKMARFAPKGPKNAAAPRSPSRVKPAAAGRRALSQCRHLEQMASPTQSEPSAAHT